MRLAWPNQRATDLTAEEGNIAIFDVVRRESCETRMGHNLSAVGIDRL